MVLDPPPPVPAPHRWEHHEAGWPIDADLDPDDPAAPAPEHRPSHARLPHRGTVAAVALGGFVGSVARYEVGLAWPASAGRFPMTTFLINTSGALVLGAVLAVLLHRHVPANLVRPFLCTGVIASWTTMSALAVEADLLVSRGQRATALVYVVLTLAAGTVATWLGVAVGRRAVTAPTR